MIMSATGQWLDELLALLGRIGELDEQDEQTLDGLIDVGLSLNFSPEDFAGLDPGSFETAVSLLAAARSIAAAELASVHRQRIDADRTVRAITAYVRTLS